MGVKAESLISAIGGKENINDVEACITRLRIEVTDPTKVDESGLRDAGAFGVVLQDAIVQVVVGPDADELSSTMSEILD